MGELVSADAGRRRFLLLTPNPGYETESECPQGWVGEANLRGFRGRLPLWPATVTTTTEIKYSSYGPERTQPYGVLCTRY